MQAAAERMQNLIHALLQYSRLSTRPEEFGPVALGPLVQEVLSDLSSRISETGARVTVDELPSVVASPTQMRQLFQNLIGNSLKFRGEATPDIRVSARLLSGAAGTLSESEAPRVEIRVADNGIGFDDRYLDKLFQPFSRLHGREKYEGTGMGLAICRKIVQRHGGSITATAVPGRGATFIVTLPLCQDGGGGRGAAMRERRSDVTVLVAEDDPDDRLLIAEAFGDQAGEAMLQFTSDGEELMARLQNRDGFEDRVRFPPPGLILLDLNMPRKDGRQALAEIKGDPILRSLPVIVLTTSRAEEDILRTYHMGANSYITKPGSFTELVSAMKSLGTYWLRIVELPLANGEG